MFIRKKELDNFLVESLKKISEFFKENLEYYSTPKDELDKNIQDDYRDCLTVLNTILEKVKDIDSLSDLSEDDIDFVYQCLSMYESDYIITHLDKDQQKIDERNHKKILKLLNLFY